MIGRRVSSYQEWWWVWPDLASKRLNVSVDLQTELKLKWKYVNSLTTSFL